MTRLLEAWRRMEPERRFAAVAALALFISMFLPWYQQNGVVKAGSLESRNLDAFQVFSFVEAAVLLVAIALLYMLYARADGRDFRLPGGDGTIILLAGIWVGVLLIFRLFDKPGISSHGVAGNVGVQWGIFFALAAAGLIAYSGSRMRGLHTGPRLRAGEHLGARQGRPVRDERAGAPRDHPQGRPPSDPPVRETEADDPPARPGVGDAATEATRAVPAGRPAAVTPAGALGRPRYPPAPGEPEQLSFEDAPTEEAER